MSALPACVSIDQPLPEEIRAWVYQYGSALLRALVNEVAVTQRTLRDVEHRLSEVEAQRDDALRRLRDRRGSPDD